MLYSNSNTFINSAVSFFCVDFVSTSTDLSRNNKCYMYDNQINEPCYYRNIGSICQILNINNNKLVESPLKDKIQEKLYNADTSPVQYNVGNCMRKQNFNNLCLIVQIRLHLFLCLRGLIVPGILSCTPIPDI